MSVHPVSVLAATAYRSKVKESSWNFYFHNRSVAMPTNKVICYRWCSGYDTKLQIMERLLF